MPNSDKDNKVGEQSIMITNLTDTGFTVIWVSKEKEQGYVKYSISQSNLSSTESDERDDMFTKKEYRVHSVKLSRLRPETKYFFNVISGDQTYDNGGNGFSVTTSKTENTPPGFEFAKGEFKNLPEHGEAIILASIKDTDSSGSKGISNTMSTLADSNGYWSISLSSMRTSDGKGYFQFTDKDILTLKSYTTIPSVQKEVELKGVEKKEITVDLKGVESENKGGNKEPEKNTIVTSPPPSQEVVSDTHRNTDVLLLSISLLLFFLLGFIFFYLKKLRKDERKERINNTLLGGSQTLSEEQSKIEENER